MCESTVFVERGGEKALLMEDVVHVTVAGDNIKLRGILGETREAHGRITEINLLKHTIIIAE